MQHLDGLSSNPPLLSNKLLLSLYSLLFLPVEQDRKITRRTRKMEQTVSLVNKKIIALLPVNSSVLRDVLDSRGEQPARLLGQPQTSQQADDQVQDEEQQVGEPPVETNRDRK